MLDDLKEFLGSQTGASDALLTDVILAALLIIFLFAVSRLIKEIAIKYIDDPVKINRINRFRRRVFILLVLLIVANIFVKGVGDLITILTIVGAGLAIALRETLMSFAGWIYNSFLSLFKIGDRIEINGVAGDVVDIRLLQTTVMEIREWVKADQSTGRLLHFPNSWIFTHAVKNFSRGFRFIWNEIPILVTFDSDWEHARDLIRDIATEATKDVVATASKEISLVQHEYLVNYSVLTPFVYTTIGDSGILLTLRYLCNYKTRRGTTHQLSEQILRMVEGDGRIELAYPSQMIYGLASSPPSQDEA